MAVEQNARAAAEAVQQVINDLAQIERETKRRRDYGSGQERLKRWKMRATDRIRDAVTAAEAKNFALIKTWHFGGYTNTIDDVFLSVVKEHYDFLFALKEELEQHPDDVFSRSLDEAKTESTATAETEPEATAEGDRNRRKNTATTGGEALVGRTGWDFLRELPCYLKEVPWYWAAALVVLAIAIIYVLTRLGLL